MTILSDIRIPKILKFHLKKVGAQSIGLQLSAFKSL